MAKCASGDAQRIGNLVPTDVASSKGTSTLDKSLSCLLFTDPPNPLPAVSAANP
jgi:hypothetical protein